MGTLISERFQVSGLVGKGGMGEVYRAYDLKLEQWVALKFLPEATALSPATLARVRSEVRVARQVSHRNVCRVYDMGEVETQPFISMEYVDGENLGSLLRRIGRLPADKALEIARYLCAGLAAAHDKGVLHRDLKPANIMIDGRGQVLIMDFGLSCMSEEVQDSELRQGTPAYMAPEQLTGKQVSVRSDIYALGLVLYEMFTGKCVFHAHSVGELLRLHDRMLVANPSSLVKDLDPTVERVILRCLDPEPRNRPPSALAVAASLGGDPLAAALAAGETPSPNMVASAEESTRLHAVAAASCLVSVLIGLAGVAFLGSKVNLNERVVLERGPDVLAQKARDIIQDLGYQVHPADSVYGFRYDAMSSVRYAKHHQPPPDSQSNQGPCKFEPVRFGYRQSSGYLEPSSLLPQSLGPTSIISVASLVSAFDPPTVISGMVRVELDPFGHLIYLAAAPSQVEEKSAQLPPFDWNKLFTASGIDRAAFSPVPALWLPQTAFDSRTAWVGHCPDRSDTLLRVEAAAWQGKPVFFLVTSSWDKPDAVGSARIAPRELASQAVWYSLVVAVMIGASLLARYNIRAGRGDRRGAFRLAVFVFSLCMLSWLLVSHHVPAKTELMVFLTAASQSAVIATSLWLIYMALEPYVRRKWPQTIISWSRMLTGQIRDPLVGSDLLIGVAAGTTWAVLIKFRVLMNQALGEAASSMAPLDTVLGVRQLFGQLLTLLPQAISCALVILFTILGLRMAVRRQWLAGGISIVFFTVLTSASALGGSRPLIGAAIWALFYAGVVFVLIRFGLVALTVALFVQYALLVFPITVNMSAWYWDSSLLVLASIFALAVYGFRTVLHAPNVVQRHLS